MAEITAPNDQLCIRPETSRETKLTPQNGGDVPALLRDDEHGE
jgi:hypothetical protein